MPCNLVGGIRVLVEHAAPIFRVEEALVPKCWRLHVPPNFWCPSTKLHCVISQKTSRNSVVLVLQTCLDWRLTWHFNKLILFQYLGDPNVVQPWAIEKESHIFRKSELKPQNLWVYNKSGNIKIESLPNSAHVVEHLVQSGLLGFWTF
jgi:hypothetical protein